LLRVAVGATLALDGAAHLRAASLASPGAYGAGMIEIGAGLLLGIGLMSPVAAAAAAALVAASALAPDASVADLVPSFVMAVAVVLLGPGAYSLDARLFGRREIVLPHAPRRPGG
jgi:uncharacterized membrane protein YphA (DoxX/SURF4 family)